MTHYINAQAAGLLGGLRKASKTNNFSATKRTIVHTRRVCHTMQLEFDSQKRDATLTQRGIEFGAFSQIFKNRISRKLDAREGEKRWKIVGYLNGEMVMAVYVLRRHKFFRANYRVISIRKVGKRDRERFKKEHEEYKKTKRARYRRI